MAGLEGLSTVLSNLNKAIEEQRLHTKAGLTEAALVVKRDSVKGTPIDLGNLRNSAFIMVTGSEADNPKPKFRQEKTKGDSLSNDVAALISGHEMAISEGKGIVNNNKNELVAIVGYTANYALWVHEMPAHYNFNSGSNKFLQKALLKNRERIKKILIKWATIK